MQVGGKGCTANPLCDTHFAWIDGNEKCDLALIETSSWSDSLSVSIQMGGKADGRAVSQATCVDYVEKVNHESVTLDLDMSSTTTIDTSTTEATTTTENAETTTETTTEAADTSSTAN